MKQSGNLNEGEKKDEMHNLRIIPNGFASMIDSLKNFSSPFEGKHKSVIEVVEEVVKDGDNTFTFGEKCFHCNKPIDGFQYWSLRKYDYKKLDEDKEPKLIEIKDFCSKKCLKDFKDKNSEEIENYEFYRVNRCSCYYDCEELDNIRGICERKERLDYEPGLSLVSLHPHNFCEPSDASIIKASINIHKEIKELKSETSVQFKLTAAMTILVIILTFANLYITLQNNTGAKVDDLNSDISPILISINNTLSENNVEMKQLNENFQDMSKNLANGKK